MTEMAALFHFVFEVGCGRVWVKCGAGVPLRKNQKLVLWRNFSPSNPKFKSRETRTTCLLSLVGVLFGEKQSVSPACLRLCVDYAVVPHSYMYLLPPGEW